MTEEKHFFNSPVGTHMIDKREAMAIIRNQIDHLASKIYDKEIDLLTCKEAHRQLTVQLENLK